LLKFPSEEWIKLFMKQLNANKSCEKAAKTWEGDFLFIIETDVELKEYCPLGGWDSISGHPTQERLRATGIESLSAYLPPRR